jgi:hypothetical protein
VPINPARFADSPRRDGWARFSPYRIDERSATLISTMSLSAEIIAELSCGDARPFANWPDPAVPTFGAGVYTVWHKDGRLIYVGMSGRGITAGTIQRNTPQGIYTRLHSHASGRRSGDQFCVYVADRLVLPMLSQDDIAIMDAIFTGIRDKALICARPTRVLRVTERRLTSVIRSGFSPPISRGVAKDHALTATFRYFVGFHSLAIRCASAIWAGVILAANLSRFSTAIWRRSVLVAGDEAKLNHMWASA